PMSLIFRWLYQPPRAPSSEIEHALANEYRQRAEKIRQCSRRCRAVIRRIEVGHLIVHRREGHDRHEVHTSQVAYPIATGWDEQMLRELDPIATHGRAIRPPQRNRRP